MSTDKLFGDNAELQAIWDNVDETVDVPGMEAFVIDDEFDEVIEARETSFINLADFSATVKEHGLSESLLAFVNEDNQLGEHLEMDLSDTSDMKVLADNILARIDEKLWEEDDTLSADQESLSGAFLVGYTLGLALAAFIDAWYNKAEKVLARMKDQWNNVVSKSPSDLKIERFLETKIWMLPKKKYDQWQQGLTQLGTVIDKGLQDDVAKFDRTKVMKPITMMGQRYDVESDGVIKPARGWETVQGSLENLGWTFKDFVQSYKHDMEELVRSIALANKVKALGEKAKQEKSKIKSDKKSGEIDKATYKEQKKELKKNRAVLKRAARFYFDTAKGSAQGSLSISKSLKQK